MISVEIMEDPRHLSKSLRRIDEHGLRCLEGFSLFQLPGKIFRMDSHGHTYLIKLIRLYLCLEIAGIYKMHGIYFTIFLIGILRLQCQERMILMAGLSTYGLHTVFAMTYRYCLYLSLSCPGTMQGNRFKIFIIHIKAGRIYLGQIKIFLTCVHYLYTSCDYICFIKNTILQNHLKSCYLILAKDLKSLTLSCFSKGCRQTFKSIFSLRDLM